MENLVRTGTGVGWQLKGRSGGGGPEYKGAVAVQKGFRRGVAAAPGAGLSMSMGLKGLEPADDVANWNRFGGGMGSPWGLEGKASPAGGRPCPIRAHGGACAASAPPPFALRGPSACGVDRDAEGGEAQGSESGMGDGAAPEEKAAGAVASDGGCGRFWNGGPDAPAGAVWRSRSTWADRCAARPLNGQLAGHSSTSIVWPCDEEEEGLPSIKSWPRPREEAAAMISARAESCEDTPKVNKGISSAMPQDCKETD